MLCSKAATSPTISETGSRGHYPDIRDDPAVDVVHFHLEPSTA
jgi:hypothetical protein